jgi:UDP-2,3-diacylglucosamine pyrophosphatase LpxH
MYVVWKNRTLSGRQRCEICGSGGPGRFALVPHVVASSRAGGSPRQVHVARLPSVRSCCLKSERAKQEKPREIMDVAPSAVEQSFRDSGCTRMIHGHTHRPACHVHVVDGKRCERWVLADWYHRGQYLRVGPEGCAPVELA